MAFKPTLAYVWHAAASLRTTVALLERLFCQRSGTVKRARIGQRRYPSDWKSSALRPPIKRVLAGLPSIALKRQIGNHFPTVEHDSAVPGVDFLSNSSHKSKYYPIVRQGSEARAEDRFAGPHAKPAPIARCSSLKPLQQTSSWKYGRQDMII